LTGTWRQEKLVKRGRLILLVGMGTKDKKKIERGDALGTWGVGDNFG